MNPNFFVFFWCQQNFYLFKTSLLVIASLKILDYFQKVICDGALCNRIAHAYQLSARHYLKFIKRLYCRKSTINSSFFLFLTLLLKFICKSQKHKSHVQWNGKLRIYSMLVYSSWTLLPINIFMERSKVLE